MNKQTKEPMWEFQVLRVIHNALYAVYFTFENADRVKKELQAANPGSFWYIKSVLIA